MIKIPGVESLTKLLKAVQQNQFAAMRRLVALSLVVVGIAVYRR